MARGKLKIARQSKLAGKIRKAIGAGPDEHVSVRTPQFKRPKGQPGPAAPPSSIVDWYGLYDQSMQALRERGLRAWSDVDVSRSSISEPDVALVDEGGTHVLMLFPGEWYRAIPRGFATYDINGGAKYFAPGQSTRDIRFGCLPYGIVVQKG
jgi:hypothetical protein